MAAKKRVDEESGPPSRKSDGPPSGDAPELARAVGENLRKLRTGHGLSLAGLADASGVSRAMLGQIELGQSVPTIAVLWKIARALNVTFSALIAEKETAGPTLLRARDAKLLTSADGSFASRALFPMNAPRRTEFYELRLAPGCEESAEAHARGTVENLVVAEGTVEVVARGDTHRLEQGDAIVFPADAPHAYRNPERTPARVFLVMSYADEVG
jgi:transcriptional regulator with XRE-family HTH domain